MKTAAPRSGLRRYLRRGFWLSVVLVLAMQGWCCWQVYHYAQTPQTAPEHADAAIVLGAAAWGEKPSPVFRERINHALTLYQNERVEKLIFTGGTPKSGYSTEGAVARRFALRQGVPPQDILFETTSKDTYQNLANARWLMRKNGLKTVIIVSDPYHMARAMAMAEDLGIRAYPSPTPTSRYKDSDSRTQWKFFAEESAHLMAYRLLYIGRRIGKLFGSWTGA